MIGLCSARGEGIKLFGPDRVHAFCRHNNIDVIIRYTPSPIHHTSQGIHQAALDLTEELSGFPSCCAMVCRSHQAVDNGYEFFAGTPPLLLCPPPFPPDPALFPSLCADKALITVFSATNYCGRVGNDGAVLEVDKDLVITPKIVKNKAPTPLQGPQHMHRQQAQATSPTHHDAPLPPRYRHRGSLVQGGREGRRG